MLPAKQEDGGRVNKIAAASYLAKCYLNLAWGDGYEATTGVSHINRDYMQKVIDYTDAVVNSEYGYLEDFGDIFLPDYKNTQRSTVYRPLTMPTTTLPTDVPTGRIC